jgi:hypothetical protein
LSSLSSTISTVFAILHPHAAMDPPRCTAPAVAG